MAPAKIQSAASMPPSAASKVPGEKHRSAIHGAGQDTVGRIHAPESKR